MMIDDTVINIVAVAVIIVRPRRSDCIDAACCYTCRTFRYPCVGCMFHTDELCQNG